MAKRKQKKTYTQYKIYFWDDVHDRWWPCTGSEPSLAIAREEVKKHYFNHVSTKFRINRHIVSPHEELSWKKLDQDDLEPARKGNLVWA